MGKSRIYVVGLTGTTGSGKTIVSELLKEHGIQSIDADSVARVVTQKDSRGLAELSYAFGKDILNEDGTLNRSKLAARAFENRESQQLLNDITHPLIMMEIRKEIKKLADEGVKIVTLDAALLFESGADILCNDTIAVLSDKKNRLERILERDSITVEQAEQRMSVQYDDDYYISHANHVIYNNGSLEELAEKLKSIVKKLEVEAEMRRGDN